MQPAACIACSACSQQVHPAHCLTAPRFNPLCPHFQITTVDEAKQFYPLFGLGANVALIFSGRAVKIFSQVSRTKNSCLP